MNLAVHFLDGKVRGWSADSRRYIFGTAVEKLPHLRGWSVSGSFVQRLKNHIVQPGLSCGPCVST